MGETGMAWSPITLSGLLKKGAEYVAPDETETPKTLPEKIAYTVGGLSEKILREGSAP